ncbi:MAG: S8 family peptidase, partial [Woeseiaceae bacterium]
RMKTTMKVTSVAAVVSLLFVTHVSNDSVIAVSTNGVNSGVSTLEVRHAETATPAAAVTDLERGARFDVAGLVSSAPEGASQVLLSAPADQFGPPRAEETDDELSEDTAKRSPQDKMSGPVAALAASGAGMAEIVVRYDQHPELFDDERVADLGGEVTRSYEHLDMRAITIPAASLVELAVDENIDWLSLDDEISSTSLNSRLAANVPAAGSMNAGYSGSNVGIAVLDTGISKHGDLADNILQYSFLKGAYPEPQIVNGEIAVFNDSARDDKFGHGTHVAGVLSGSGKDSSGEYKGTAAGATVLALQVLDQDGGGSMSDVMAALDWLLTYGSYFDIRVVNLSLGKGISESNTTDPLVIAVEKLWDAGMVVVVAAGNEGFSGSMTVTSPGNSRKVITVGSLTDSGTGTDYSDDYVSSFSSRGPTIGDYVLKPDLLAPGNRVVASIPSQSKLAIALTQRIKRCARLDCGNDYLEMSGTSMATPLVSAAAALMLDKDPSLTPATVKARLMRSARKLDADPSEAGAGLLDVDAALDDSGYVSGEALSPLMVFDNTSDAVLVEDTAALWGDAIWGSGYLYNNGFSWASGASFTDENGVTANGYMWTDGGVSAKGYMWTDGGVSAKGYMWTDGVNAKSLLSGDEETGLFLNDDGPAQ